MSTQNSIKQNVTDEMFLLSKCLKYFTDTF